VGIDQTHGVVLRYVFFQVEPDGLRPADAFSVPHCIDFCSIIKLIPFPFKKNDFWHGLTGKGLRRSGAEVSGNFLRRRRKNFWKPESSE
ncbi:MAG: hypothetical protein KDE33_25940, partial [Bacteroidetes bacterium]|nr:hypothetical protein [Bacteroidota bacterium]